MLGDISDYIYRIGPAQFPWLRENLIYTPSSAALIYFFARNKGIISKYLLKIRGLIYIGNISSYCFLIHIMVIQYFDIFYQYVFGKDINSQVKFVCILFITIICSECYMRLEKKLNSKYGRQLNGILHKSDM